VSTTSSRTLVLDSTCLSHFARAERLDVLRDLLVGYECWTTEVVRDELRQGLAQYPDLAGALDLDWVNVSNLRSDVEIARLAAWALRVGAQGARHLGEASVLACAELLSGIAITDDREAVRVARAHGLEVHGTVWLLASACRDGKLTVVAAGNILDALIATGMRLPCTGADFSSYAARHGLL
jgi:predicted nucleic acid-binding protein